MTVDSGAWVENTVTSANLRSGAQRLAEEHETVTTTWYTPDEFAELVRAAGFREVTTGPAATEVDDGESFTLTARL